MEQASAHSRLIRAAGIQAGISAPETPGRNPVARILFVYFAKGGTPAFSDWSELCQHSDQTDDLAIEF